MIALLPIFLTLLPLFHPCTSHRTGLIRPDYNLDGSVDGTDLMDFYTDWEGDTRIDRNGDGQDDCDCNNNGRHDPCDPRLFMACWILG